VSSPRAELHVLIAGGGLSGLCLAHGLIGGGHTCEVFERDPDLSRKAGYLLNMNADGGEALRRCLPDDLFELYAETSRRTPKRRQSIVLDSQLNEISSQPHLGPPNEGERPHTGVDRRTLRRILQARLGDSFHSGNAAVSYEESAGDVHLTLADGSVAEGDVLVGADGIRSAIRAQRLPDCPVIEATIEGIGVYGRSPLSPEVVAELPPVLLEGFIIAADRKGARMLLGAFQPRRPVLEAGAQLAPDVALEAVGDYLMVSCSVEHGAAISPARDWTPETAAELRDSMLRVTADWHPAFRGIIERIELDSMFMIPFGRLDPAEPWTPSRVTLVGDAAHAMLPTLGLGANLALRDAHRLHDQLSAAARGEKDLVEAIGAYEEDMREYVYPFMRMTMEHDRHFGGGGLERMRGEEAPPR
jgi:2-polyprenyl-6-methoxyphenol hydroxylase-like FAD-dependent oxidoreductase